MIRGLNINDAAEIARIHKRNLPGILSFYPEKVIRKFYEFQLSETENFAFGFEENGKLLGFVFGTMKVNELFIGFVKKHFTYFLFQTVLAILKNPKLFLYYFSSFFSGTKFEGSNVQLVYIAVDKNTEKKGTGKALLHAFEEKLKDISVSYYELEVEKNNPALGFYIKNNFFEVAEINNLLEKKLLMGKNLSFPLRKLISEINII